MKDNKTYTAGEIIALVDEHTPTHLEYGDYRGWVVIDAETGEYLRDSFLQPNWEDVQHNAYIASRAFGVEVEFHYTEEYAYAFRVVGA